MAKLWIYESNEDYQLGRNGICIKEDKDLDELIDTAKEKIQAGYGNEIASIISHDYEGFIGELGPINRYNKDDIDKDELWLSPDPNYKGNIDNRIWGTLNEFKNNELRIKNEKEDYER